MPYAEINGIKVHYRIEGNGPPLLLLAPGGFNSVISNWTAAHGKNAWKEMDALATLSRHFRVIAYDRREAGSSGGRIEPLTWDGYASEAAGLLDVARVRQAYVMGGCMGVSVALALAARHPSACKGLLLHWPVGGYQWMLKGQSLFNRHIQHVRSKGLAAIAEEAPKNSDFWNNPEFGPWVSVIQRDAAFAAEFARQDVNEYLEIVERSRDALFNDVLPPGASGQELMQIRTPALVMSGADGSHTVSAGWILRELMPNAERWDVLPPHQNGGNTLEQILAFARRVESGETAAAGT